MRINELFKIQQTLEEKLSLISGMEENALGEENVLRVRFLALQVKLGELANLTKCYKYRKNINEIPRKKVLFRYLEGLKYLLSIGNKYQLNMIDEYAFENIQEADDLITLFSQLYDGLSKLKGHIENDRYVDALSTYIYVFAKYVQLSTPLNVSYDEAKAYFNELNIEE